MAWVTRGGRGYSYRSVRRSGRVTSVYVMGGIPAATAEYLRECDQADRSRQAAERAEWLAERDGLNEIERRSAKIDAAYDELATLAMLATGHHRPKRDRWRKRKPMENEAMSDQSNQVKPTGPRPASAAEMAAMLDRIDDAKAAGLDDRPHQEATKEAVRVLRVAAESGDASTMPALRVFLDRRPDYWRPIGMDETAFDEAAALTCKTNLLDREITAREIRTMRDHLAGPAAPLLERLLAERVAINWFDAHRVDLLNSRNELAGCTQDRAEFLCRQRSRAQARFLAAAKSLAVVRRLAMPVLHLHKAEEPPAPATSKDRLRVVGDE